MAHALQYIEPAAPEKPRQRMRHVVHGRYAGIHELKRRALVARLRRKALVADEPSNWATLTSLSDDQALAVLRRR